MLKVLALLFVGLLSTGSSNPIKHLIILMMENRSFDHYLGWLKEQNPQIDGLTGNEYNCVTPGDTSSQCVYVNKNGYDTGPDDPMHDFDSIVEQVYGFDKSISDNTSQPKMNGFVWNANLHKHDITNVMRMFTDDSNSAPVLNTLAMNYGVFDNWFCSVPGPTDPNRAFSMSGTSNGMVTNYNGTLWSQQSYFDKLTQDGVSWKAYYDTDVWAVGYFADMNRKPNSLNIFEIANFYDDVQKADLPSFIWLQPRSTTSSTRGPPNWQHPDASVQEGERLIKSLYEALMNSSYWNESAMLITYDEHGGFFDHVAPPQEGVPNPDGVVSGNGFNFDRLGIRIPTVIVSPWIKKGTVIHEPCDACKPEDTSQWEGASAIATSEKLFNSGSQPISERAKWAATFESYFEEMEEPRMDEEAVLAEIPDVPMWNKWDIVKQSKKALNDHQVIQVRFYCQQLQLKRCPDPYEMNQGSYSKFVEEVAPQYMAKIQA